MRAFDKCLCIDTEIFLPPPPWLLDSFSRYLRFAITPSRYFTFASPPNQQKWLYLHRFMAPEFRLQMFSNHREFTRLSTERMIYYMIIVAAYNNDQPQQADTVAALIPSLFFFKEKGL